YPPAVFGPPDVGRNPLGWLLPWRTGGRRRPLPVIARLARSAAGRAALTSTIYARPGRRSPEAVVAETLALAHAEGFADTLRAGTTVQFTDDIPGLPVTVAWGTRDRLLVRRQGIRAKHIIPRARLVRLPGCGHVPMNDDPALVARVILDGSR
ncbi:alpha/beta fold hydrolase, partial [Streptomyces sp. NPDC127044]